MRYNIIGKNIDVWDKTKEMVEHKMDRVAKLFPEDTEATITLSLEKLVSTVEVTVPMNKRYVRAEVQDPDMTAAMDKAVDAVFHCPLDFPITNLRVFFIIVILLP